MPATVADAIDGVVPVTIVEPATAEDLAATLASASDRRQSVVIRGGGTKMGWGRRPAPIDILLSTRGLNRLVAHDYPDLTATMQAGARLDHVNAELARHGQWLPLESPFDSATIGGAIATNDSGPLRHRYGTPRDLLIGIRLALADGRIIKSGGNVVKNVAGYDLGKLVSGSFGSLAAIVSATFKLVPLPAASATVVVSFDAARALVDAIAACGASQVEMAACDVHVRSGEAAGSSRWRMLVKCDSTPNALAAQTEQVRTLLAAPDAAVVRGPEETELWRAYSRSLWALPGAIVRAGWLPASLGHVLHAVEEMGRAAAGVELVGRAAVGSGLLRVDGDAAVQRDLVARMRAQSDVFRHVVVLRASTELKSVVDVWGSMGDAAVLGTAVKQGLDPQGTLNAGRGPV